MSGQARRARWLDPTEQRAWRAFVDANRLVTHAVDAQLQRDSDMPHAYYEILARLSEAPGRALRMAELAARSRSSRSRLSHAVARLEARGWVRRSDCLSDRRGQVAELTADGYAALVAAAPRHVAQVRAAVFDALDAAQVEQLAQISEAIAARLGRGQDGRDGR